MRIDTRGAATYTGVSESKLEKLRVHGGGPIYLKVGRKVIYDTDQLDIWLGSLHRASTSSVAHGVRS